MSDIALIWDPLSGSADFAIEENDLKSDTGLETAIMLSLYIDRIAEPGDVLPEGETNRRGWWADAEPVAPGDKFGSRLWLLDRAKQTADVLSRAEEYTREGLAWPLEDRVASEIDAVPEFTRAGLLGVAVTVHRPALDPARYQYDRTWDSQAGD